MKSCLPFLFELPARRAPDFVGDPQVHYALRAFLAARRPVYLRENVQRAVLFHSGSLRRFYCVGCCLGPRLEPGPANCIAEKLTQDE